VIALKVAMVEGSQVTKFRIENVTGIKSRAKSHGVKKQSFPSDFWSLEIMIGKVKEKEVCQR
jgi:hypothetical protein